MKLNRKSPTRTRINCLLIDGEALLKQGFHGAKQVQTKNGSVGAIFHFINTIKRFYQDFGITKVVVFWEGENSKQYRQGYYPYYKQNRNDKVSIDERHDLDRQRLRIKQYLEEIFIRQVEIDGCEADDGIAHYVRNSPNENKMIYTNDRDLLQLISDDTKVYLYGKKAVINIDNFKNYFDYHYGNVGLIKIIAGDSSDNISGLEGIGEETVLKLFPELKKEKKDYDWVIGRVDELLNETPSSKKLQVIKYLILDLLSAAIAWTIFFIYRKFVIEPQKFGVEPDTIFSDKFLMMVKIMTRVNRFPRRFRKTIFSSPLQTGILLR